MIRNHITLDLSSYHKLTPLLILLPLTNFKVFEDKPHVMTGKVKNFPGIFDNPNQIYCLGNDPPTPGVYYPSSGEKGQRGPGPAIYLPYDSVCYDCDIKSVTCKRKVSVTNVFMTQSSRA